MGSYKSGAPSSVTSGEFDWEWYPQADMPTNPNPAQPKIKWMKSGGFITLSFPACSFTNPAGNGLDISLSLPPAIVCGTGGPGIQGWFKYFPPTILSDASTQGLFLYLDPADPYLTFYARDYTSNGPGGTIVFSEFTITYKLDW